MLNLDTIRNATVYEFPYRWAFIQNALTKEDSLQLARTYPSIDQFQEFHWEGNGFFDRKPAYCTLKDIARIQKFRKDLWKSVESGKISSSYENLNESWQKFITNLLSPAHREAIGDLLRLNLKDHITRVSFRRLRPKHFGRTPHTDFRSGTTVTQLYFFNQEWQSDWGGCFQVLASENPESVICEVPPILNTSVAIVFSENSWHMGTPVAPHAPDDRLFLLVTYWQPYLSSSVPK